MVKATTLKCMLTQKEKLQSGILELWLEIGTACSLKCPYCLNAAGRDRTESQRGVLGIKEYLSIVDQFATMGGRVIGIPGYGEPFHPANRETTLAIAEKARDFGIRTFIITGGDLINELLAKRLKALDICLIIKCDSLIPEIQDILVGHSGYTKRRDRAIRILMDLGFNTPEKNEDGDPITRMAFETIILKENRDSIFQTLRYCRKNNLGLIINSLFKFGRGQNCCSEVKEAGMLEVLTALQKIDQKEFGFNWNIKSPTYFLGKGCCDRFSYHLYIDHLGNISHCIGSNGHKWYIGNRADLLSAWNSPEMDKIRNRDGYTGLCIECQNWKAGKCNSCFGRAMKSPCETIGCWLSKK